MKRTLAALILTTALATPLVAQETPLSGTVAEIFGTQIVLTTPEGRLLVTLPEGATVPTPGTRLDLTGTRTGDTFAAATLMAGPAADPAEAMLPAALRGLGLTDIPMTMAKPTFTPAVAPAGCAPRRVARDCWRCRPMAQACPRRSLMRCCLLLSGPSRAWPKLRV